MIKGGRLKAQNPLKILTDNPQQNFKKTIKKKI